jgi:cytochrome oxidase Cu insertion factor (SCO1/SenC/PrrC family)
MIGELYLIDPKGNAMMHFSVETPPKDILTDVKRLLRNSR